MQMQKKYKSSEKEIETKKNKKFFVDFNLNISCMKILNEQYKTSVCTYI